MATEQGTETHMAKRKTESLARTERLMEEVCELENCKQALQRVKANKGSPGVDGMTVEGGIQSALSTGHLVESTV
jgi:RNA-directed DNA polymerase